MKHPIFLDPSDRDSMAASRAADGKPKQWEVLSSLVTKTFTDQGYSEQHAKAYINRINTMNYIQDSGCQLIQLKDPDAWDEVLSRKTIEKMKVSDITMPFPAFTIDVRSAEWTEYDYIHLAADPHNIIFYFDINTGAGHKHHVFTMASNENIADEVEKMLEWERKIGRQAMNDLEIFGINHTPKFKLMENALYKVISIIMYSIHFFFINKHLQTKLR